MALYLALLNIISYFATGRKHLLKKEYDILLTGTFYSQNWLIPHLQPLACATACQRIRMVATSPVPSLSKVEPVYPPQWLCKLIGNVPARLIMFTWLALKDRPQIVGGFHLQLNGLLSILLSRVIGARSLYICGGGEREILGGGYLTETKIFRKIGKADIIIEKQLLAAIRHCDLIIVMGSKTKLFFENHKVPGAIHIMPGGFNELRFQPVHANHEIDLITIGRLSMVKRIDLLIETISLLRLSFPSISTIIVGDGPDKEILEERAKQLGLLNQIRFIGHQDKVEEWLRRSKIFVLCSDSEGVSQAMIQAMLCGLPVVVSNVGDLADVVLEGVNGFLITERTPMSFAERISVLLSSPEKHFIMGQAARKTAEQFGIAASSQMWDAILTRDEPRNPSSQ
jgi:glycosyltransferase involved in cell wall biosynthesis